MLKTLIKKATGGLVQRAILRERGCMPDRTFVLIIKRVDRTNLCETPALAKPPPRCAQVLRQQCVAGRAGAILWF